MFRTLFLLGVLTVSTVNAQQWCPSGQCPVRPQQIYDTQPGYVCLPNRAHWTYPGRIEDHLPSGHGVDPTGMSREEMLNLHDALHEGRAVQPTMMTRAQFATPVGYTTRMYYSSQVQYSGPARRIFGFFSRGPIRSLLSRLFGGC